MDSQWHENAGYTDSAEFTVLLPGYIEGQSNWTGGLINIIPARNANEFLTLNIYGTKPIEKVIPQGLMLCFHKLMAESNTISLGITYQPNQGLDETAKVTATFKLSDGWFD